MNTFRKSRVKYLSISFALLFALLGAFFLLPPPQNSNAACNPPDELTDCCTGIVSYVCIDDGSITGAVTSAETNCLDDTSGAVVAFECTVAHTGRSYDEIIEWVPIEGYEGECPASETNRVEDSCPVVCTWTITGPDFFASGEGCEATAVVTNLGEYVGCFTVNVDSNACFPVPDCLPEPFDGPACATQLVASVSIDIPELIGVNDLVKNCLDPAGYPSSFVTNSVEFNTDDDLKDVSSWSASPADLGDVSIASLSSDKIKVLTVDGAGPELISDPVFPYDDPPSSIKIEGVGYSETVGDALVEITYGPCTAVDTTTVVRVLLDKFNYNRANPFPEVEIVEVDNFEPGEQAQISYKILGDVLNPEQMLNDTYQVEDRIGIWEYKTPEFANRLGNEGWDTIRYTVYGTNDAPEIRWEHADPSHARMESMPDLAAMQIDIKDATAEDEDEAYSHLTKTPDFAGDHYITGATPSFDISEIKVFASIPSPAYTNELSPEIGNEQVLMNLCGVSQDSAVVLEIKGENTVVVNDRFEGSGDPGDDAVEDRANSDPDFIRLDLSGVPDCIVKGTVTWEVQSGDIRLVSHDATQVETSVRAIFASAFPAEYKYIYVEGLEASDAIDDCLIRMDIELDAGDASSNPAAFQGQTLSAEFKLTVTDQRWTGWKEDGEVGKTGERLDMLACDLDLRPAVRIDTPVLGETVATIDSVTVTGSVRSMIDIVRDIRINGEQVPQADILFLGQSVDGMTADSVREFTDAPPPYVVTFEYNLQADHETLQSIEVVARNGIGPLSGSAERKLTLETLEPPDNGSYVTFVEDLPSDPAYNLPDMVEFFDAGWKFLYKTEVDHRGAGKAVVECYEKDGVQPDGGLFRLRMPVIFLHNYGDNNAIPGPGIFLDESHEIAPIEYNNGVKTGRRKLYPVELNVTDNTGIVSNSIEWTHGAILVPNSTSGTLEISLPEIDDDFPEDATVTLKVADVDGHNNPYSGFTTVTYNDPENELPATISLPAVSDAGVASFEVEISTDYGIIAKDRVKVSVIRVDLDIDSDNDEGFGAPDRDLVLEDAIEDDSTKPGKLVCVNDDDSDGDGIPDYADGFDWDGASGTADEQKDDASANDDFVQIIVELPEPIDLSVAKLKITYNDSDPVGVTHSGTPAVWAPGSDKLRIWKKDGNQSRNKNSAKATRSPGDYVPAGEYDDVSKLGLSNSTRTVTLYVEGVDKSAVIGDQEIKIEIDPYGSGAAGYICSDAVRITVVKVDIAMDGNRDGTISFDDPEDKEYLFWVNNDYDVEHFDENDVQLQQDDNVSGDHTNCDDDTIGNSVLGGGCERDLEDFTRLNIRVDENTSSIPCVTYWLRFGLTPSSPSVNIFEAVDGTTSYLTDINQSSQQIDNNRINSQPVTEVERQIDNQFIKANGETTTFLLEGCSLGEGDLTFVVKVDGEEICSESVFLELKGISFFYKKYTATVTGQKWDAQVSSTATPHTGGGYQPETDEMFLFVHGWNMNPATKTAWAETVFKRLWWQGYKGGVALFDWPTLYDYNAGVYFWQWWDLITESHHFDNSEYISWLSADALIDVFTELNANGKLRVLAHSMGNVVTASALHKYPETLPPLHTYIAAQAAISAHYYDNGVYTNEPAVDVSIETPDVMGHYSDCLSDFSYPPYMDGKINNVTYRFNYHNFGDFALRKWNLNNQLKPDNEINYNFGYWDSDGLYNTYDSSVDCFYRDEGFDRIELSLIFPSTRYQIFSYIAQSRSLALGHIDDCEVDGFTGVDLYGIGASFDNRHYSHSREFRSHIAEMEKFWNRVAENCQFSCWKEEEK